MQRVIKALLAPISQHMSRAFGAIHMMRVRGWSVCVAMNHARHAMRGEPLIHRFGCDVHQHGVGALGVFLALGTGLFGECHAFRDGLTEKPVLPFGVAHLIAKSQIRHVFGA